jgi:hypothetical protein
VGNAQKMLDGLSGNTQCKGTPLAFGRCEAGLPARECEASQGFVDSICGGAAMESPEKTGLEIEPPAWVGYAKTAILLGMVGMLYWLGQSMVANHFFSGQ